MATAYHMEALRKQRVLERKQQAAERQTAQQQGLSVNDMSNTNIQSCGEAIHQATSDHRQAENHRLARFRVSKEGFENRYRDRAGFSPHVDNIYKVLYFNNNNDDYTSDECRNKRRLNKSFDKYQAEKILNGELHLLASDPPL